MHSMGKKLEETRGGGVMVGRLKTRLMDFVFEQNEYSIRKPNAHEDNWRGTGKSYPFQMPRGEYRRGMLHDNGDHSANGTRLD